MLAWFSHLVQMVSVVDTVNLCENSPDLTTMNISVMVAEGAGAGGVQMCLLR